MKQPIKRLKRHVSYYLPVFKQIADANNFPLASEKGLNRAAFMYIAVHKPNGKVSPYRFLDTKPNDPYLKQSYEIAANMFGYNTDTPQGHAETMAYIFDAINNN